MASRRTGNTVTDNLNLSNKLLSCLYSQRKSGKFCDVILNVGEVNFSVHSCVLASFSEYFNDLVMSAMWPQLLPNGKETQYNPNNEIASKLSLELWSLSNPLHLTLPLRESEHSEGSIDCSDCTSKILDFMYLGKIQLQNDHVEHVRLLSTILEVSELLTICDKFGAKQKSDRKRKSENNVKKATPKKQKENKCDSSYASDFKGKKITEEISSKEKNPGIDEVSERSNESLQEAFISDKCKSEIKFSGEKVNIGKSDSFKSQENKPASQPFLSENGNSVAITDEFKCSVCHLKFSSLILLRQHRETHKVRLHNCYACKFSSHKAFDLIKHLLEAEHQETMCSLCFFEAEVPEKLKDHLKLHNHPKPFFCSICNIRFHNRASLNTHTPKHSTEMPYSCSVCSRGFKWKQGLQSHMIVHTPEKKHLCSECGFSTAYQSTFRAHVLVHTNDMFQCQHSGCTFKTVRKQNFVSHLKTHNKEKPYQCEVCGQSYSQAKNLRRHAVKHDAVAEDFIEHCPLCLYQTMRIDKLKIHFKKHHPDGDEKLLSSRRKKSRTLNFQVQKNTTGNDGLQSVANDAVKDKTQDEQTASVAEGSNLELSSDISSDTTPSTLIVAGLNTQTNKMFGSTDAEDIVPINSFIGNEEAVGILLDINSQNFLLVPSFGKPTQPLLLYGSNSTNEMENTKPIHLDSDPFRTGGVINSDDQNQQLLRTEPLSASVCVNPTVLFVDNDTSRSNLQLICNNDFLPKSHKSADSTKSHDLLFTDGFKVTQMDGFISGEATQPAMINLDESSVFSNTTEQLQRSVTHLDIANNDTNTIQELFPVTGEGSELQGLGLNEDTNTLDLSKDVPQLVGSEETLGIVLDNTKDQLLICHETLSDDTDKQNDNRMLPTFRSFESILDCL